MESKVLIRVDASRKIGSGHLMRCLAIADFLKYKNIKVFFLSRSINIKNYIIDKGFKVNLLKAENTVEDELNIIKSLTAEMKTNVMILDVNNYNTFKSLNEYCHYLEGLKKLSLFLVSFEDFKVYPPISDMVIIPYVGAEKLNLYEGKNCKYMLGPKYFVLREEFLKVKHVIIRNKIKNILVTMGGSDSEGITLEVLRVLCDTELDISLKVVIGGLSQIDDAAIKNTLNSYKGSYSIIRDVSNMAQIMSESDIAIINSGLTKYETSAVGLPSIVISNNKYHSEIMNDFAQYGSVLHLGTGSEVKKDQISKAVIYLVNDYEKRQKMSNAGKSLIDGDGVAKIFSEIPRELFYA